MAPSPNVGRGGPDGDAKHLLGAAVFPGVRLAPVGVRLTKYLSVALLGALSFLIGHAAPEPDRDVDADGRVPSSKAMSEAWSLADAAQGLAEAHRAAEALSYYERAYELSPDSSLLFELGRLHREVGNQARAAHAFERLLAQSADLPEQRRAFAARQLQAASASIARLNLQTNVLGATVELEPERGVATARGFAVAVLLDAGERRISLSKPGFETQSLVLQLAPGEVRTLRVDLDKAAAGRSDTGTGKLRWTVLERAPHESTI